MSVFTIFPIRFPKRTEIQREQQQQRYHRATLCVLDFLVYIHGRQPWLRDKLASMYVCAVSNIDNDDDTMQKIGTGIFLFVPFFSSWCRFHVEFLCFSTVSFPRMYFFVVIYCKFYAFRFDYYPLFLFTACHSTRNDTHTAHDTFALGSSVRSLVGKHKFIDSIIRTECLLGANFFVH